MVEAQLLSVDATIANQTPVIPTFEVDSRECCLVQIYPANITDGLMKLKKPVLSIGRESTNDLALVDGSVSRQHAKLERGENGFFIRDLGSTNGTFVNDQRVTSFPLVGGETIRIGSFIFKFLRASAIEAQYHSTVYDAMTRDGLTGAFNKSYLLDSLAHEIARSRRCRRPLSVLIMDIDHFKKINDTYGHLVGDEVLREFGARLAASKRCDDLLCRYGGEEFVAILGETGLSDATNLAERCRLAVCEQPFSTTLGPISVTVSIGAAQLPVDDRELNSQSLLELADKQLYRAKQTGRNRVCV